MRPNLPSLPKPRRRGAGLPAHSAEWARSPLYGRNPSGGCQRPFCHAAGLRHARAQLAHGQGLKDIQSRLGTFSGRSSSNWLPAPGRAFQFMSKHRTSVAVGGIPFWLLAKPRDLGARTPRARGAGTRSFSCCSEDQSWEAPPCAKLCK